MSIVIAGSRLVKCYPVSQGDFDLMDRLCARRRIAAGAFGLGLGFAVGTYGASLIVSAVAAYYWRHYSRGLDGLFTTIRARVDPLENGK